MPCNFPLQEHGGTNVRGNSMLRQFAAMALILLVAAISRASESPLGRKVEDFKLRDFRGEEHALSDYRDSRAVVVVFLGTECPLAKLYAPRLAKLAGEFGPRGVSILGINANAQDSISEIAVYARQHDIHFPILKDTANRLADSLGATRTPVAFVLDADQKVRYIGRIDDQYGVGYVRREPQRNDLKDALDELLAGKAVTTPITEPVGCVIGRIKKPQPDAKVTYSNQIARILQNRCVECHREGEIAPFALTDYDEVVGWAETIQEVVQNNRMPPWHATHEFGHFENDRSMPDEEKEAIYAWVRAGAPKGDPDDLPEPRKWVTGWQLSREPDFVAPITAEPYAVPAEGEVRYQYFQIDPGFKEDKWVDAIEIQPGNRAVVHHILMVVGTEDDVREFDGGAMGYDGLFVPGQRVKPYSPGMARRIAAGSRLIFQVHYTPNGSKQFDQSRIGMTFVDPATVKFEVRTASAVNTDIRIPPGEANYRVESAGPRLPAAARLLALNPHMHLRGKKFFYEAVLPNGERKTLMDVPNYDFNWQTAYRFAMPLELPENTRLHCIAHFDNSNANLNNPDPVQTVRWGQQTWDEMMIGYFDYAVPVGTPLGPGDRDDQRLRDLFDRLDRNVDGRVVIDEVPKRFHGLFKILDGNHDGTLSLEEMAGLKAFRSLLEE
jgi:peroxiredoxin